MRTDTDDVDGLASATQFHISIWITGSDLYPGDYIEILLTGYVCN